MAEEPIRLTQLDHDAVLFRADGGKEAGEKTDRSRNQDREGENSCVQAEAVAPRNEL